MDDDYEVVTTMPCGCEHCSKINAAKDKAKQIEELLAEAEINTSTVQRRQLAMRNVLQILRIMNGIE
jgi:hypothetical protein